MEFLLFVCVVVVGYLVWRSQRANQYGSKPTSEREDRILATVEEATLGHLQRFPNLGDEEIAQLVRDDLLNSRVKTPEAYRWATAETAGRMRRNVMRAAIQIAADATREPPAVSGEPPARARKKKRMKRTAEDAPGAFVVRIQRCESCHAKNRGDSYRCSKCGDLLPSARE
jgi:hypothetical protein